MANQQGVDVSLVDLLYQSLETELGAIRIYREAIDCAASEELRKEWMRYLSETRRHERVLLALFKSMGMDPTHATSGRTAVASVSDALVKAMRQAREAASSAHAELVACDCVVLAETKSRANWELLGHIAAYGGEQHSRMLRVALEDVEHDDVHPLFHTRDWMRELWLYALGFAAILPPPGDLWRVRDGSERAQPSALQMHGQFL